MSFFSLLSHTVMIPRDRPNRRIEGHMHAWPLTPGLGSVRRFTGWPDRWFHLAIAVFFLTLTPLLSFRAQAATQIGGAPTESEIRAVADAFRQAIIDKDGAAFTSLFLDPSTATWVSVESDARLAAARASDRSAGDKVLVGPDHTPLSFILGIVQSTGRHDETMENLRISTDGEIASVHFEFAYLYDGQAITTGEEAWLLVRTADGWRIVSVVWSKR